CRKCFWAALLDAAAVLSSSSLIPSFDVAMPVLDFVAAEVRSSGESRRKRVSIAQLKRGMEEQMTASCCSSAFMARSIV
ncbi:hypothetical protein U1Q18_011382, partial [Sarracenia purpurea var. burkii]